MQINKVPISRVLKTIEQRLLAAPRHPSGWRMHINLDVPEPPSEVSLSLPLSMAMSSFLAAREAFFALIRGGAAELVMQGVSFREAEPTCLAYTQAYLDLIRSLSRQAETASGSERHQHIVSLRTVLAVDSVHVILTDFRGRHREAVLADLNATLPDGEGLKEWEVPFDLPDDWPDAARVPFDAFHAARQAMQRRMDDSIAAHADQETLYDQPKPDRTKLRITGPFSVEAVPFPSVVSLDEARPPEEADATVARSGESARQHQWRDELLNTGVRGKGGQVLAFAELETLPGTRHLHASGTLAEGGARVVVSFGPAHAALEQRQVEQALREAGALFPLPSMIVFCAFEFDPEAAKDIDAIQGITALKAKMNADLLTEDLKKGRASNQSFWLMGQPDVEVRPRQDGRYEVEVHGFDYFDTKRGELVSGGKSRIALWLLDTDYDERSLYLY